MAEGIVRLVNRHRQPLELYAGGQVIMLSAGGQIELSESILREPQPAYLIRAQFLSVLPPAAARSAPGDTPAKAGTEAQVHNPEAGTEEEHS